MSIIINNHRDGDPAAPPLVLLHGIGHHWQAWRPVIDRLAGEFSIVACDSPGFGRSAPLPAGTPLTIPSYADAFTGWLRDEGLEGAHVAGNSMGGAISLELARRRVVSSATALAPAGFWSAGERRWCQGLLSSLRMMPGPVRPLVERTARTTAGRVALFNLLYGFPARLPADEAVASLRDAWGAPAFAGALRAFDEYTFSGGEQLRGVPVTVAWGDRDRLLPYDRQAPRARAALPWARHVTLGGGHLPYHDDPAAVAEVIRQTAAAAGAPTAPAAPAAS